MGVLSYLPTWLNCLSRQYTMSWILCALLTEAIPIVYINETILSCWISNCLYVSKFFFLKKCILLQHCVLHIDDSPLTSNSIHTVMLMGTLLYGVKYTLPEYFCTFLVAGGVSSFALLKVRWSSICWFINCHTNELMFLWCIW